MAEICEKCAQTCPSRRESNIYFFSVVFVRVAEICEKRAQMGSSRRASIKDLIPLCGVRTNGHHM